MIQNLKEENLIMRVLTLEEEKKERQERQRQERQERQRQERQKRQRHERQKGDIIK